MRLSIGPAERASICKITLNIYLHVGPSPHHSFLAWAEFYKPSGKTHIFAYSIYTT